MKTRAIRSYVVVIVCLLTIVIARSQSDHKRETAANRLSISQVKDYRKMFRVNQVPVDMVEQTKTMCAPPVWTYGPHYNPGVVYYINQIARQGLTSYPENKLFPVGSIIVKEKQERRTEDSVLIITVMKKVQPGTGEDSWEYKMYDTNKWIEVEASDHGMLPERRSCIECHRRYKDNDYVSNRGIELLFAK